MNAASIINALAATTKRTEKEQIITDAFMRGERDFFVGAKLAYDCLLTFGVKKVAEIGEEDDGDPGTFSFDDFLKLAEDLRTRRLTGHAARDAIHAAAERCNVSMWNTFYRRVLLKDLRCGIDTSTFNKVLKKLGDTNPDARSLIIPVFGVQLAQDGAKPENQKRIRGRKMLDIKLDGVRLASILNREEGTVVQHTRNGAINENFTEIREALHKLMDTLPGSVVLDGEITGKNFQELMKQVNRRDGVNTKQSRLAIFDIIPLTAFKAGICEIPQEMRHMILAQMETSGQFKATTNGLVYAIPKITVDLDSPDDHQRFLDFNKQAIEAGYEGIMLKDPDAPYELKRTFAWMKMKPFIEVTLEITGYYAGEAGKQFEHTLGGLIMEGVEDGRKIKVDCGGGFTVKERDELWAIRDDLIGTMGEVRADAYSLKDGETVYSLRFPRWKGRRGFKPGEIL